MRLPVACLAAASALALAALGTDASADRKHRPKIPPPQLPRSLSVDESEWRVRLSKTVVAAGRVRIRVYNRGEDDHNLVVLSASGAAAHADLKPGGTVVLNPLLRRGRVRLVCTLQAGTPQSHEAAGMRAVLSVR